MYLLVNLFMRRTSIGDAGEINEALFSCRKAVEANPENASAHSLLASLYELDGDMESAMYEYERALALDPKSTSDRARLEDLKVLFDISVHAKAESGQLMNRFKPYIPVARAVAVICLVLVVGLTLGRGSSKHQETPTGGASSAVTNVTPAVQIDARQQQEPPPQGVDAQQPAPAQASTSRQVKTDSPAAEQSASTKQPMTQTPTPPTQPTARTASANEKPVITPVITTPTQPDNTSRVSSPILPVESSPSNAVTSVGTASSDPERYAFRLQTMQRYQQAISSYQEALAKTKDKGRIYQQIAMCYQNLANVILR